jgi:hypothetical protein
MSDSLEDWLSTAVKTAERPAVETRLREVESQTGCRLPDEVRNILTLGNKQEGFVGASFIAFFDADDLIRCWHDAQDSARGFVPFASNGGGEYYGWDSRHHRQAFLLMPSIGME